MERERDELQAGAFSLLLANLTHELKTPLHSILSLANVMLSEIDGDLSLEQRKQVEMMKSNGEQLLELITELLNFSTVSFRSGRLSIEEFDVHALCSDIAAMLAPVAQQKGMTFVSDLEKLKAQFASDAFLVRQIVNNLLSNAIKYSPAKGEVTFYAETRADGSVCLQIADSGIGISPELHAEVFAELEQGRPKGEVTLKGVGLGLALVKASVEQLGGTIELRSEEGHGALFTVQIPRGNPSKETRTVVVVDADRNIQASVEASLHTRGFRCVSLENPSHDQIEELAPSLLLIDFEGARTKGGDFLQHVKGSGIPIVISSPIDGPDIRKQCSELGANRFYCSNRSMSENSCLECKKISKKNHDHQR